MGRATVFILGSAILVALLFGANAADNLLRFRTASGPFALALTGNPNWHVETPDTRVIATSDGLRVRSDRSRFHYQIVSDVIAVTPDTRYFVDYDIDMIEGRMFLGVLDVRADRWLAQWPIEGSAGRRESVIPPSRAISLILSNNNGDAPAVSEALIRRVEFGK